MKFALLGVDDELLALASAIAARKEHEIAAIFESGEHSFALHALAPSARTSDEWEALLLTGAVDVVLIGRAMANAETRADQLKKLAQAMVPMVIVHPGCEYIDGYELEMIRSDVKGVIIPYCPGIFLPLIGQLAAMLPKGLVDPSLPKIGAVEQMVVERRMVTRSRDSVLAQLARDASLIRQVLGDISQVSASGKIDDAQPPINLSVQMSSAQGILARWSVGPAGDKPGATATLVGAIGKAQLELSASGEGQLQIAEQRIEIAPHDEVTLLLDRITREVEQGERLSPTWQDACRAAEIAGTVPRCLARGKTIDLYNEEHTEDGAFKGTMAVGGCLLILFGLLAVVFVAVVEGLQLPLHDYFLWRIWPVYLLTPIVAFLLLQVVGALARRK